MRTLPPIIPVPGRPVPPAGRAHAASPPRRSGNNSNRRDQDGGEGKTGLLTKVRPKTKKPSLYKVLLLNDDYTPQEFVVHVLERFFNKSGDDATRIMLHVHQKGVGICGVYTYVYTSVVSRT